MTDALGLERGYRRLLGCYPRAFRDEHADEMLAVLMASAGEGQRRPGLRESANLFWSALTMRLRGRPPASETRPWTDALALFSLVAPVFVLLADVLTVTVPYRRRLPTEVTIPIQGARSYLQIEGGLRLLHVPIFAITAGAEVIIAVLVLLGLRWITLAALAATAGYWIAARDSIPWIPYPVQLITTGIFILVAAALVASPGPRRGRQLVNWRCGVVLVLAAAAVQASAFAYDTVTLPGSLAPPPPAPTAYLVGSIVLALAVVILAVVWKLNRYFLLLLAAAFWPYAIQLAFVSTGGSTDLLGNPTPVHLVALYVPPVLFACGVLLAAVTPRRARLQPS